jgi:Cu(I)/Ag(I) efflux system membrane fusion protein
MNKTTVAVLAAVLVAGVAGGFWLGRMQSHPSMPTAAAESEARKILFYRNPMNPEVTSPVPAKDEMGMDYVPVYADAGSSSVVGTVEIDPTVVQNMGVRLTPAEMRSLSRIVRTVGRVEYNEQGLVRMHLRSDGWIERLEVDETGQRVERGQPLLTLYSPQIVSAEQEYRLALAGVAALGAHAPEDIATQARALSQSSAERLRLLGVPESEIRRLRDGGEVRRQITLTAPVSGVVQSIGVREGQFVSAQTEVYRIADLSTVWVIADLYEDEVPWVRTGDAAQLRFRGLPGQVLQAEVDYVYPYLDGKTRTQKVRLQIPNPEGRLKPEMYADVSFEAAHPLQAVAVPESAVVRSGTRAQVFVATAPGRFEPREVKVGVSADGQIQILEGLDSGEQVVVSGQFLIDSESKLREATAKMMDASKPSSPASTVAPAMDMKSAADPAHSH